MENKITMSELLERFKDCDMFSLTGTIVNIKFTEKEKNIALKKIKEKNKQRLLCGYNNLSDEYSLPSFEKLYKDIEEECIQFEINNKEEYMKKSKFFKNSFIGDLVWKKSTRYYSPSGYFWNFYHDLGLNLDREIYANELMNKDNNVMPVDRVENEILKSNLIKYEISFYNHCTESGGLMVNYYFKLNDDTKKWLLQFESDFDIVGNLEDLAFYKDDEILFSSCTHEQFNSLRDN